MPKSTKNLKKSNQTSKPSSIKVQKLPSKSSAAHVNASSKKGDSSTHSSTSMLNLKRIAIVIAGIIIVAVLFSSIFYKFVNTSQQFQTFKSNFNSAKNVSIYLNYTNQSAYPSQIACASDLIQELTGPTQIHRNANTINYDVLYNNSCVYNPGGLGTVVKNYSYVSKSQCLSMGAGQPAIFISYSSVNSTIINGNNFYLSGNAKFLALCGISYQIT